MPHFAASDLVLHCLPMSHKKDAWLIWVKDFTYIPGVVTVQNSHQLNPELGQKCSEITMKCLKEQNIHRKQSVYAYLIVII